jgi:ATP-dependent DNA ligase
MTKLPTLYKYTTKGQVQEWTICIEDNTFYTIEGIKNGKLTTATPTICKGKNSGKANATTDEEQALKEAKAKWQKKIDKGYAEVLTDEKKFFEPMLAESFKEKDLDFKKKSYYVQPKLDGARCILKKDKGTTRNGKIWKTIPHLYNMSEHILDGELYNHALKEDFNTIMSLVRKDEPTEEGKKLIQYWIYDIPSVPGNFSDRYDALRKFIATEGNEKYVLVPTYRVRSLDDIKKYHEEFLSLGFEGTMVRVDAPYENKRTKSLMKYKDFKDEEYEIVEVIEGEGNRTGTVGKFRLKLDDQRTFDSNIKGDFNYLKDLLKNKDSLIGKKATVKYFNLTPAGVPRFPYVINIDRESYE